MILFLDDTELRHRHFTRSHIGSDVLHVWSASQAISALEDNPTLNPIHLDHDLAYEHYGADPESFAQGTGLQVARWLANSEHPRDTCIIIHSLNPIGSQRMAETLRQAGFTKVLLEPFRFDREMMAGI